MIKLIVGGLVGVLCMKIIGNVIVVTIIFLAAAVLLQITYPKIFNKYLEGMDPLARMGAKNIKELKGKVEIPFYIQAMEFAVDSAWYALAGAILFRVIFFKG